MKSIHRLSCVLLLFLIPVVNGFTAQSLRKQPEPSQVPSSTANEINLSAEQEKLLRDLSIERCCYPFNETIYNFYRYNFDQKRSKKRVPSLTPKNDEDCRNDAVYIYRTSTGMILAALRLTRSKADSRYIFLRSLCVSREYRRQRLAMRFLDEALADFSPDPSSSYCYCFASPYLEGMYQRGGFTRIHKPEMELWPKWLVHAYNAMDEKWSRKTLGLFIKEPQNIVPELRAHRDPTHIILLQHGLEFAKATATGWLLDDKLYFEKFTEDDEGLSSHLVVDRWVWRGRNDTESIENRLSSLGETSRLVLLWTGGSDSAGESVDGLGTKNVEDTRPKAFVILDGTWQQAKTMHRRIPLLWSLSRLCLRDVPPSKYILRGDYSGWRDRFGAAKVDDESSNSESSLLCTAEVVAAVLDLQCDPVGSTLVRSRLEFFQSKFLQERNQRKTKQVPQ